MKSILDLPRLGDDPTAPFPPTREALESPNGLLAWGGVLDPQRLLGAYRHGIFPWYSAGQPVLWWSPAPRCVIFPAEIHLSQRTRRRYNSGIYHLTADAAFDRVMEGCAAPRRYDRGTWITDELRTAFGRLHGMGYAHSIEVWEGDELVGGIYGLAIGAVFFGESMFHRRVDASKIALIALCRLLVDEGYGLLDCQVGNPHLYRMGAVNLERRAFEDALSLLLADVGDGSQDTGSWADNVTFEARW